LELVEGNGSTRKDFNPAPFAARIFWSCSSQAEANFRTVGSTAQVFRAELAAITNEPRHAIPNNQIKYPGLGSRDGDDISFDLTPLAAMPTQ
jgi:hypothetical protein